MQNLLTQQSVLVSVSAWDEVVTDRPVVKTLPKRAYLSDQSPLNSFLAFLSRFRLCALR